MNDIYLDNAATTRIHKDVLKEMMPYLDGFYGNPSGVYKLATFSKKAVENARSQVSRAVGASNREIYFTCSGSESNNWALIGIAETYAESKGHIITSSIEHHSVLHTCKYLEQRGYEVTYLPVNARGMISVDDLKKALRQDTILISIMFANNEIGTIQPIREIGLAAKEKGILFHTDAVQAVGHLDIDVEELNIDLMSMSAHKIYGPKGTGALYINKNVKIDHFIHGGTQERNHRAGTENVAGIVGLGKSIELAFEELERENERVIVLREKLIEGIAGKIPNVTVNGDRVNRLPGNVNLSFESLEGESILLLLESKGIAASSGAACSSGSIEPSHVLLALGISYKDAYSSVRFTLGRYNTEEDIVAVLNELPPIIEKLRAYHD